MAITLSHGGPTIYRSSAPSKQVLVGTIQGVVWMERDADGPGWHVARRTLTSTWLSVAPPGWPLRLVLESKNLGDQQAADVAGFPLPGRSVFLACASRLGHNLP